MSIKQKIKIKSPGIISLIKIGWWRDEKSFNEVIRIDQNNELLEKTKSPHWVKIPDDLKIGETLRVINQYESSKKIRRHHHDWRVVEIRHSSEKHFIGTLILESLNQECAKLESLIREYRIKIKHLEYKLIGLYRKNESLKTKHYHYSAKRNSVESRDSPLEGAAIAGGEIKPQFKIRKARMTKKEIREDIQKFMEKVRQKQ